MSDLIARALASVTRRTIEEFFPGGSWAGSVYAVPSPITPGSAVAFRVSENGRWTEGATGAGDFLDLIGRVHQIDREKSAAKVLGIDTEILLEVVPQGPRTIKTKEKDVPVVIPIPRDAPSIKTATRAEFMLKNYGEPIDGWAWDLSGGGRAFQTVLYTGKDNGPELIPFYFGEDGQWHMGQPMDTGRPLLRIQEIERSTKPVLLVNDERGTRAKVSGYEVTTWQGNSKDSVTRTDWAILENRDVVIWPKIEKSALLNAKAMKNRLGRSRILTITGKPEDWDIVDAMSEGLDLDQFIKEHLLETLQPLAGGPVSNGFFEVLGYDDMAYYFLKTRSRAMFSIGRGAFTSSKLGELAPLTWWSDNQMTTDQQGIKVALAQDLLQTEAESAGRFKLDSLRGAGVWRDNGTFVVNDGRRIVTMDGQAHDYHEFKSEFRYVSSDSTFPGLVGPESTDDEGGRLFGLFTAQRFVLPLHAVFAMGWCLIAPFGGVLAWRPHMWLNGESQVGKSWLLENIVFPLVGEFSLKGTGTKSTPASIKRVLNRDARPVILEECEGKTDDSRRKVTALVELARDASTDTGAESTISVGATGFAKFITRAMFFFTSIGVQIEDQAADTRIQKCDLSSKIDMREKKAESKSFYGCMKDPAKFRRRVFRSLPRIMDDTEKLREVLLETLGAQRAADQVAPVLAAAWAIMSKESIISEGGKLFLSSVFGDLENQKDDQVKDEDAVVNTLLMTQIRLDDNTNRTIGEVLSGMRGIGDSDEKAALLGRHGLRVYLSKGAIKEVTGGGAGKVLLAMATSDSPMKKLLMGTPYETSIDSQIKRHSLCLNSEKKAQVRVGPTSTRVRLLDWAAFKEKYLKEEQGELG